jgi:hypothetical protein
LNSIPIRESINFHSPPNENASFLDTIAAGNQYQPGIANGYNKFIDAGDCVVITVNDDLRKLKRDFKCKKLMLLNHMKYFE